jgi:hypothetical protein
MTFQQQRLGLAQAVVQSAVQELAARYAVWHVLSVLSIVRALGEQLGELGGNLDGAWRSAGHQDAVIPDMPEFFYFIPDDKQDILRKRRWP